MPAVVKNIREAHASFDLTIPENLTDIGVDGVSQALIGFPSSKITFHVNTQPSAEGIEQRKAVLTLSIGTLQLLQMCQITLASLKAPEGIANVDKAVVEYQGQMKTLLENVDVKPISIAPK